MNKILWLTYKNGLSAKMRPELFGLLRTVGISENEVFFVTLAKDPETKLVTYVTLRKHIALYQPDFIVCQDFDIAKLLNREASTEKNASKIMNKLRGSIYNFEGVNILCLALFDELYGKNYGRWLFLADLNKLKRWVSGNQFKEPRFRYFVAHDVDDLVHIENFLERCDMIAVDIETVQKTISCIGFAGWWRGGIYCFVIPFVNPTKPDNTHWKLFEAVQAWNSVRRILGNEVPKTFQNGNFDNFFLLRHRLVVNNWLFDTYHAWHCVFQDPPKSLAFITSICVDNYTFWKEENKGDETEKIGKDDYIGKTAEELTVYWRYNARDCYYTLLSSRQILFMMIKLKYPVENFRVEMNVTRGQALLSTCHGMPVNLAEQSGIINDLSAQSKAQLAEIHKMAATTEFNPNSSQQLSHFVYNVLGCSQEFAKKASRNKKTETLSVDKNVLKRICETHPLYKFILSRILNYKELENTISKYAKCNGSYKRFYWRANTGGTKNWRQSTNKHHMDVGSNAQNIPNSVRKIFDADDGWWLFDFDYAQSDLYYIAHESQDEQMIETVLSDKDTHIIHGSLFFKIPYEEFERGYKAKEDFYANKKVGLRQLTKHISHGSSGGMRGRTMHMRYMGREEATVAARALGKTGMERWQFEDFVKFCDELSDEYFRYYFRCKEWQDDVLQELQANNNLATIGGGMTRKIFGKVKNGSYEHRDLLMYYGQGGTGCAINRSLNDWLYEDYIDIEKCHIFLQVHDSLVGKVRYDGLGELVKLKEIMERRLVIKGREFFVPAGGQIGYMWGDGNMIDWHPEISKEEIEAKAPRPKEFSYDDLILEVS